MRGFLCIETRDKTFISDAGGRGIFRTGPGMTPIRIHWEIVAVMRDIYSDVDSEPLKRDISTGLHKLN